MLNQKTKILISGRPEIVSTCQELLKNLPQWNAFYAHDKDSLLEYAAKYIPDVIFIDLLMPDFHADEIVKDLRLMPGLCNTSILTYYSPNSMARDHFAIRAQMITVQYMKSVTEQAGAKEYLGQFNPNQFLDLIDTYRKDPAV